MKRIIYGAIVVLIPMLALGQSSRLRRAWLAQEQARIESDKKRPEFDPKDEAWEQQTKEQRWERDRSQTTECPKIAEVTKVTISKTVDTQNFVIRFYGPDFTINKYGKTTDVCSLWLTGGDESQSQISVQSVSAY